MAQPSTDDETEVSRQDDLEVLFDPFFLPIDDPEGSDLSIDLSEDPSYDIEMDEYWDKIRSVKDERARQQKALEDAENEVLIYDDGKKKKRDEDEEGAADSKKEHATKSLFTRPEPPPAEEGEDGGHLFFLDESIPKRIERGAKGQQTAGSSDVTQRAVRVSIEEATEPEDTMEQKVGAPPKRPRADLLELKLTKEELNEPHQRGLIPRDAEEDHDKAEWNFKTSEWKNMPLVLGEVELYTLEGNAFYVAPEDVEISDGELEEFDSEGNLLPPLPVVRTGRPQVEDSDSEEEAPKVVEDGEEEEEEEEEDEEKDEKKDEKKDEPAEPTEDEKKKKKKKPKKLLSNMFNYADREVLTVNSITRVRKIFKTVISWNNL